MPAKPGIVTSLHLPNSGFRDWGAFEPFEARELLRRYRGLQRARPRGGLLSTLMRLVGLQPSTSRVSASGRR